MEEEKEEDEDEDEDDDEEEEDEDAQIRLNGDDCRNFRCGEEGSWGMNLDDRRVSLRGNGSY